MLIYVCIFKKFFNLFAYNLYFILIIESDSLTKFVQFIKKLEKNNQIYYHFIYYQLFKVFI